MTNRNRNNPVHTSSAGKMLVICSGLAAIIFILFITNTYDPFDKLRYYLEYQVNPYLFLALMLILPIIGFPISVFLVLVGMKFGSSGGVIISALMLLLHMMCTYFLIQLFFRDLIVRLMHYFDIPIPERRSKPNRWHALLFMLVPGLPYAMKNCLLALSGLTIGPYLYINWSAQFGLSVPLVIFGSAVMGKNLVFLVGAFILVLGGILLTHHVGKRYRMNGKKRSLPDDDAKDADRVEK